MTSCPADATFGAGDPWTEVESPGDTFVDPLPTDIPATAELVGASELLGAATALLVAGAAVCTANIAGSVTVLVWEAVVFARLRFGRFLALALTSTHKTAVIANTVATVIRDFCIVYYSWKFSPAIECQTKVVPVNGMNSLDFRWDEP
jgi:hypothetical protein